MIFSFTTIKTQRLQDEICPWITDQPLFYSIFKIKPMDPHNIYDQNEPSIRNKLQWPLNDWKSLLIEKTILASSVDIFFVRIFFALKVET